VTAKVKEGEERRCWELGCGAQDRDHASAEQAESVRQREGKEEVYAELKVLGTGRDDGDFLGC